MAADMLMEDESIEEITNIIGEYEGERNDEGERHGKGKAVYFAGDIYQGMFQNGKRHGFGTYKFVRRQGARYQGNYADGKRNGEGTFHYPNGSVYIGNWVNGLRSGAGTYYYPNGDTYSGTWDDDKRHGKGVYTYAGKNIKYIGEWEYNEMNGLGVLHTLTYRYEGMFDQGHPTGNGKYIFKAGCIQNGMYYERRVVTEGKDKQKVVLHVPQWKCHDLRFSLPES